MSNSFKEALKEMLRVLVLAVLPVLILSIENGFVDWREIAVVGVLAVLRFLDKLLYENGVQGGLTRF